MPFSNSEQISPIFSEIKRKPVRSVLDVGCGLGVYGMLCRVQLDLYNDEQFYEKLEAPNRDRWEIRIDGIEGTPEYVPLIPDWAYDDLEVGEALQALEHRSDGQYDLVLALAIIEHFSKQDGERFLDELIRIGGRVIVSVPKRVMPQEVPGKPYETHRSDWSDVDFQSKGFNRFLPHPGVWIAVYDPDDPPIEPPSVNSKANPSTATLSPGEEQIVALLQQLDGHVQQMLEQQRITNERLSLSIRIRSLLERLRRPFRSKPTS
jgi:SAM-dependent methyltransferase